MMYEEAFDVQSAYPQIPIREKEKQLTAFEANRYLFHFRRVPFGVPNGVLCFKRTIVKIIHDEGMKDTFAYVNNITVCGKMQAEPDANVIKFYETFKKYNLTFNDDKTVASTYRVLLLFYSIKKGRKKN